ncbi:MAG: PAS domain S-box protein, partial [Planctomycetes bacterium]|nr:PAS domain S-box protein [Planctomycetota bacterium]
LVMNRRHGKIDRKRSIKPESLSEKLFEKTLSALFDNAADAIFNIDTEGNLLTCNRAAERLFDLPLEEMLKMNIGHLIVALDGQDRICSRTNDVNDGLSLNPRSEREAIGVRRGGIRFPVFLSLNPICIEGLWRYNMVIARDMSKLRKIEFRLRDECARLSTLMDNRGSGIRLEDKDRAILYVNGMFCELFSIRDRNQIIGSDCQSVAKYASKLFADPEGFISRIEEILEGGNIIKGEVLETLEGVLLEREFLPIYSGETFVGNLWHFSDITERVHRQKEQRELERKLTITEGSAVIGRMAMGVAHEINNPLASAANDVELLKIHLERTRDSGIQDKSKEILERVSYALGRVKDVVNAIRRHRPSGTKLIDLNEEIEAQLTLLRMHLGDRIRIVKNFAILPAVRVSGSEIGQVFLNLIVNAAEAIENKGTITISSCVSGESIFISIMDDGKGIGEEALKHIFEPFYSTKLDKDGTGLGLSTSREIMRRLGGELNLKWTEENIGTEFILEFKCARM